MGRTRTAVEYEVEVCVGTFFRFDGVLTFFKNLRSEFYVARLVNAVNVAERCGKRVSADTAEFVFNKEHIFGRGVKFCTRFAGNAVFFAADNACLNFKNELRFRASFEKTFCYFDVFLVGKRRAVEHVRV